MSLEFYDNQIKICIYLAGDKNDPKNQYCTWTHRPPVDCDYTEIVFVYKDSEEPMQEIGNHTYLIDNVPVHDEHNLLTDLNDTDECYAVYLTSHILDKTTGKFYHSDPVIIAAQKDDLQDDDDTIFKFDCSFYVNRSGKIAYSFDGLNLDCDYFKVSESEYAGVLHCEFAAFICNDLKVEDSRIFFNDEYLIFDRPESDSFTKLLTLDGMNDVLNGCPMVYLKMAEGDVDAHSGEFSICGRGDFYAGIM